MMKAIVCEMCGSQDLVKQDGYYVCQNCGTKYDPEEAKKLMVEISGSVKVDNTERVNNLYQLARRAKDDGNYENAANYYEQISIEMPNDWEANFYKVFCKNKNSKDTEILQATMNIGDVLASTKTLINEQPDEQQKRIADQIYDDTLKHVVLLVGSCKKILSRGTQSAIEIRDAAMKGTMLLLYNLGEFIEAYDSKKALTCYSSVAEQDTSCVPEELHELSVKRAKQIDSNYTVKVTTQSNPENSGGCYVATAVYGSYDCPQVWTLRRYRDYSLAETWYGRAFVHTYYAVSPILVKCFGKTQWFKNLWKPRLDKMVKALNEKGVADTPYQDKEW